MQLNWRTLGMTPRMMVVAPLIILSVIFLFLIGVVSTSQLFSAAQATSLLIGGFSAYAVALALLCRIGLRSVSDLEKMGMTDSLSQLPNRRALHPNIRKHFDRQEDVAIALIDLDGFKMVNDLYGHPVGDQLIKKVAVVMQEVCGKDAHCYRLGGDEFAFSMGGPLAGTLIEGVCRRLLERLSQPIPLEDRRIAVGASIGLAGSTSAQPVDSSELLRRADVAMYASKRGGKMRCTWFKPDFDLNLEAIRDMDSELRNALLNREFEVHYQPLVDAKSRRIVAVESLIRWIRPDGKVIGPSVFIPVAEESGLINPIGLYVLRQSCMDARNWGEIKLSVNVSSAQLRNPEFPVQLGQILEETGFAAERLELEITETCLVLDPVVAGKSLDVIRGFGVNVVLDDFGTGYASIGFLRHFRFEKLKLDRSLVVDSASDESSRAMMLSSISMAQALKMDVTAEGVETEAQAELVRSAGCDQIQGWLYFKAMPKSQLAEHLSAQDATSEPPGKDSRKAAC